MIATPRLTRRSQLTALRAGLALGLLTLATACTADITGGSAPSLTGVTNTTSGGSTPTTTNEAAPDCASPAPGPSPLRRLTHREYDNTVRDLLGDDARLGTQFSREEVFLGFDNNATARGTTPLLAEQYMKAAEQLAGKAVQDVATLTGCNPDDTAARDACARAFLERFGARALRGPLRDDERARFGDLYAGASRSWGFAKGVELALAALLQSSRFLYRVEFGAATPTPGVALLTPFELAARISYLIAGSLPDQPLLDAATTGQLSTREQVATQARRLLQGERSRYVLGDFHRQWLALDAIDGVDSMLPGFSDELRPLLHEETTRLVDATLFQEDGKLGTLLTAPFSFMNARLASFYGVAGPSGDAFEQVQLDPTQRLGILTQGGVLAAHSHAAKTSPVLRGKFVREQLLCNPPPPPPPGIDFTVSDKDASLSVRAQSELHRADPACAACHRFMDPVGLSLEGFDAAGRFRSTENGVPVVTSGELIGTDVDGPLTGAAQLAQKLAQSRQVRACVVRQWFRYAYARDESADQDRCTVRRLEDAFAQSDGRIPELLFALTQTDAFLYRSIAAGEAP